MSTLISQATFRSCTLLTVLIILTAGCRPKSESDGWQTRVAGKGEPVAKSEKGSVIMMGTARNKDGGVAVSVVDTLCEKLESRIIAIDKEGNIHLGALTFELTSGKEHRFTRAVFSGLALEDITEFRFQMRPYQRKAIQAAAKYRKKTI